MCRQFGQRTSRWQSSDTNAAQNAQWSSGKNPTLRNVKRHYALRSTSLKAMDISFMNRKTILVAEDNPDDAFLLKRAFAQAGINVRLDFVQDGEQVIHYLKGENGYGDREAHPFPVLLLLDLKMPRLDGFDVLEWLRQQPGGLKRLLVTVLTSSDQP